jgi:hypothetical protein
MNRRDDGHRLCYETCVLEKAMTRRRLIGVGAGLAALYCSAYLVLRLLGILVHFENRSGKGGHQVRYPADQWDALAQEMAEDSGQAALRAKASMPGWIDAVFLPLRACEAWVWNAKE